MYQRKDFPCLFFHIFHLSSQFLFYGIYATLVVKKISNTS
nr:MAG TPA: hypothetical protein [Caudoviricetes sp.]